MKADLPPDPDLDDLPRVLAEHGVLSIRARDPETGETFTAPTTHENVARGLADLRRQRQHDDAAGLRVVCTEVRRNGRAERADCQAS